MCARSFTEWWRLKMEISRISRWLLKSYAMAGSQYFWGPKTKQMQFFLRDEIQDFFPRTTSIMCFFPHFLGGHSWLRSFFWDPVSFIWVTQLALFKPRLWEILGQKTSILNITSENLPASRPWIFFWLSCLQSRWPNKSHLTNRW